MNRFLLPSLAGVVPPNCNDECRNVKFVPICQNCTEPRCVECNTCRIANDAGHYNIQDGACISKEQYGVLAGLVFASVYALFGIFAGHITDRHRRVSVVAWSTLVWVVAGAGQAVAHTFAEMVVVRILLGAGEAFLHPAAYSLIADGFPQSSNQRGTANAVFSWSIYLGYGLSSISIVVAGAVGWRLTCVLFNILPALAIPLIFLAAEPIRSVVFVNRVPMHRAIPRILSSPLVALCLVASSFRQIGGYTFAEFLPIYFKRKFPENQHEYSAASAVVVIGCGIAATLIGGRLSDWLSVRVRGGEGIIIAVSLLLACPFVYLSLNSDNFATAVVSYGGAMILSEMWVGPMVSLFQAALPSSIRGVGLSMFTGTALIGNLGPTVLGFLDPGDASLGRHLSIISGFSYVLCAVAMCIVTVGVRRDWWASLHLVSVVAPEQQDVASEQES